MCVKIKNVTYEVILVHSKRFTAHLSWGSPCTRVWEYQKETPVFLFSVFLPRVSKFFVNFLYLKSYKQLQKLLPVFFFPGSLYPQYLRWHQRLLWLIFLINIC